ncbi:hypothetical protein QYE76_059684 [Lolium multiflorum]|uniref:MADS-box domain-containing protein n=1 Tax=Lolium multiflorum TaxID=4521 RepID=A0AAD8RXL4_LOLMU|nr:hypothetical protein QYE76_059684 [Lolium multiflorum]
MVPRMQRGGTGRKRIDTARLIQNPAARQVAFSKRRNTLFNMAGDLSALCGVQTAVVVFSSSARGNCYAFGSPSVDAVLRRLDGVALPAVGEEEEDAATLMALRTELEDTKARVEAEKARTKAVEAGVKRAMEAARTQHWWEADVNAVGAAELPEFEAALCRLRDAVLRHADSMHAADQNGASVLDTTGRVDDALHADHTLYLNN